MRKIKFLIGLLILLFPSIIFAAFDSENISLISRWPYGTCQTVFADGNYAYIENGTVMEVINVLDPNSPSKIGECVTESRVNGIAISGGYAYIANWSDGFRVIDISNPSNPIEVAALEFEGQCWSVSVFDNYAYVCNDTLGLRIINISDPTNPVLDGTFVTSNTSGTEYVQVVDTFAYLAAKDGLYIVDISDPSSPVQRSYSPSSSGSYNLEVVNNIVYLPEFGNGIRMVNVTDPDNPVDVGYFDTPGYAYWINIEGDYGYIADRYSGVYVIDISNPTSPAPVSLLETADAYALHILGNYLYLACVADDFLIINKSNPNSLTVQSSYTTGGYQLDVYYSDNFAYVANADYGLSVIDFTNSTTPAEVTRIDMEYAQAVCRFGDYLYVLDDGDMRIFYIADQNSPNLVGIWTAGGYTRTMYVLGNYAYLGGYYHMYIIDISDPSALYEVGSYTNYDYIYINDIFVLGNYAYLAVGSQGLRIINVEDPTNPFEAGSFPIDNAYSVSVSGDYAYVVDLYADVKIINISDPNAPYEVSSISNQYIRGVYVYDNFAYIVSTWLGIRSIDISDPYNPFEVGFFDTGGYSIGAYASNDYICVADGGGGVYVLKNDLITDIDDDIFNASSNVVSQNYPNPLTSDDTTINVRFSLIKNCTVSIDLYNIRGQHIETLINEERNIGEYVVPKDVRNLSSGIYFIKFNIDGKTKAVNKFVLMK